MALAARGPVVCLSSREWGTGARQVPACSLPGFAAEVLYLGRALRAVTVTVLPGVRGRASATSLPSARLSRDVRHGHLVPCASVSPPGDTGPWGRALGLGGHARMWVEAHVGPPSPISVPLVASYKATQALLGVCLQGVLGGGT